MKSLDIDVSPAPLLFLPLFLPLVGQEDREAWVAAIGHFGTIEDEPGAGQMPPEADKCCVS